MNELDEVVISATVVPEADRLAFLPEFLGRKYLMIGEALIYRWTSRLAPDYNGGFWQFVKLSNGGFFMYPQMAGPVRVRVDTNGYVGEMSVEGAAVVACLFALCDLCADGDERMGDLYHLPDFSRYRLMATPAGAGSTGAGG